MIAFLRVLFGLSLRETTENVLTRKTAVHRMRGGDGRSIVVGFPTANPDQLVIVMKRRVVHDDFAKGKLVPVTHERFKRGGAKRETVLCVSFESAESLHKLLGQALKNAHRHRRSLGFINRMLTIITLMGEPYTVRVEVPDLAED